MKGNGFEQEATVAEGAAAGLPIVEPIEESSNLLRSRWSRWSRVIAWAVTIGLLVGAALRVICHDAWDPLLWFNAFTLYVYLPAYVLFGIAAWQRLWLLAAANSLLIACHVFWVAPSYRAATTYPAQATAAVSRPVRIFCANIRAENPDHDGLLREIASVDPDIVALLEYRRWWTHSLKASPVLEQYKYGTQLSEPFAGEVAIFSRLPLSDRQMIWNGPRVNGVVDIPLGEVSLRLFILHGPRPFYEGPHSYGGYWESELPKISKQPRPLVVMGDFNATQFSRVYEQLISLGLRSGHSDRGRGYATTWPNGEDPLPPIRIDQAFLSPEVECLSIAEGIGYGSDHKPLILEVRVHPPESAAGASGPATP